LVEWRWGGGPKVKPCLKRTTNCDSFKDHGEKSSSLKGVAGGKGMEVGGKVSAVAKHRGGSRKQRRGNGNCRENPSRASIPGKV